MRASLPGESGEQCKAWANAGRAGLGAYLTDIDASSRSPRKWLGWLGSRHSGDETSAPGPGANTEDRHLSARHHVLNEIAAFLLDHGLEISPDNLVVAHGIASGSNPGLARKVMQRLADGGTVTQAWLDEVTAAAKSDEAPGEIKQLMVRLEQTLDTFSKNTTAARHATSNYGDELEQQVADLAGVQQTGQIISTLADLAKAMLEKTRSLEAEMRTSESEARGLRRSLEKAQRDAEVDHLTGLPNRRAFEAVLEREHKAARAALDTLVLAFCDIDHFKRINDTHGHEAGDRVLRLIADLLSGISDDKCHVSRHGGEEFVMLFRGCTLSEAKERLDRLREGLAERRLVNRHNDEPFGQITFSAGVADVFDHPDPRAALKAADEALYAAKTGGRNQIHVAPKPGTVR
jgi:diguanylate cyclase